jgi:hypothetical protein
MIILSVEKLWSEEVGNYIDKARWEALALIYLLVCMISQHSRGFLFCSFELHNDDDVDVEVGKFFYTRYQDVNVKNMRLSGVMAYSTKNSSFFLHLRL